MAADRVISAVDPDVRHGHKTSAHGFDGYKGHIADDPDSEIITATTATPGNSGDAEAADELLADILPSEAEADNAKVHNGLKVQPPSAPKGHFGKDRFDIDLDAQTVTCPAGSTVTIRPLNQQRKAGIAEFGAACAACPLAAQCTTAKTGRTITIGHYEAVLAAGRARQTDSAWKADYRATRPKVERKIGHLMRRRHCGRRARVRGLRKVAVDFALLAAAVNLARLGVLGITRHAGRWTTAPAA